MYTAEQIRNKVYAPDVSEITLKAIERRIMLADAQMIRSIKIKSEGLSYRIRCALDSCGYNLRDVSFLGVNYLEISW